MITEQSIINHFLSPIEFDKNKKRISKNITSDLALNDPDNSPHSVLFKSENPLGSIMQQKWNTYFTDNKQFLRSFQKVIKRHKFPIISSDKSTEILNDYLAFKNQTAFNEKYEYVNWTHLYFLNKSSVFLQCMAYYNMASPILNLSLPILFLIFPFILLKFIMRVPITFTKYKEVLHNQFKNHAFGKLSSIFSPEIGMDKKITGILTICFYLFTIYQNVLSCIKFYHNSREIQTFLERIKTHIYSSISLNKQLIKQLSRHKIFGKYIHYLTERNNQQYDILDKLLHIQMYSDSHSDSHPWIEQFSNIGKNMAMFYKLQNDEQFHDAIMFSLGLHGFIDNLNVLQSKIKNKQLGKCTYSSKKSVIKDQYYIYHINEPHQSNSINLNGNYIITGPNASGKTTMLKTTLLNILFSQQFGFGCYKKCKLVPYFQFDSYINIPDTSGRDSLFQAEARRCLNILRQIKSNPNQRYFVIFDELYSGTNPYEATHSATSYLEYLSNFKVTYLLTTHYHELTKIKNVNNYRMQCSLSKSELASNSKLIYTYVFEKGISHIKGGFKVLEDLGYPGEIIKNLTLRSI
jgi:hypothetical protein